MRTLRSVALMSALSPAAFLEALDRTAAALTEARVPQRLRRSGIGGARVGRRGTRFVLALRRRRRAVAPMICSGRVEAVGSGSRIHAQLRPSRQWLWFPAIGTLLFLVQLMLAPPTGLALVGYAVVIGILWAINLLAATMPAGSEPGAEAEALEELLTAAAAVPPPSPDLD